jgi:hypothetical protein
MLSMCAFLYAFLIRRSWDSDPGVVMLGVFPSQFVEVARITALIGSPFRIASFRGFMKIELIASPLPYPSALSSKVLHIPLGDKTIFSDMVVVIVGAKIKFVPATTAEEHSPE